ncbi:hypothetical protein AB0K89_13865 [Streptomyces cinnamoneus]|uniref:hypothetical protein n=1 Tax=Streptomyces cinnamoneus TaxID=53446 RepID=UPI00342CB338
MPTYETLPRFTTDLDRLTPEQRRRFRQTVAAFIEDLRAGSFRAGLRIKRVRCVPGVYELTGPATAGPPGNTAPNAYTAPSVVWRRIGTHAIPTGP